MSLQGKIALVTGASRALGEGAARDGALAQTVAREIGAEAMACDVSDYAAVKRAVAVTRKQFGGLDILVNNRGVIDPTAEIASSDPAAWARNIQINPIGAYAVRGLCDTASEDLLGAKSASQTSQNFPPGWETDNVHPLGF